MAKTSNISGWAAAGMKPPLNAYQLFARELRKSDNTPADVKSSVPKFSTFCSNKWKNASTKTKDKFNKAAAEIRVPAEEELRAKKASERGTKRSYTGLANGWAHIRGDGNRVKDKWVHSETGATAFTKVYSADEADKRSVRRKRGEANAAE